MFFIFIADKMPTLWLLFFKASVSVPVNYKIKHFYIKIAFLYCKGLTFFHNSVHGHVVPTPLPHPRHFFISNYMWGIPESWKFLLVESWILDFGTWNTAQGIRNATNDWNPESRFHRQRNLIPGIRNPRLGIQNPRLSCIPTHGTNMLRIRALYSILAR